MKYVDIHTHRQNNPADIEIINMFAHELELVSQLVNYSVGFHPWHIGKFDETEIINGIHSVADLSNVMAIGECGIDLAIDTDIKTQERIFLKQMGIAENKSKPLIIHCVRAYNELIRLRKAVKAEVPWIIHGFSGNTEQAIQLLKHGFYLSFGEKLIENKEFLSQTFSQIPVENIFFETDEGNATIQEIYSYASKILKQNVEDLKFSIFENYKKVFLYD